MSNEPRKHYYNDFGILDYDLNRKLLVKLAKTVNFEDFKTDDGRAKMRQHIVEIAIQVLYDFSIYEGFGESSIGGSLKFSEYREKIESDPTKQALKELIFDFHDQGYLYNEFMLVAWSAACDLQIYYLIPPDDNDDEFGE